MSLSIERRRRRTLGVHLTPAQLFRESILPYLKPLRTQYRWVDLFAGTGELIFPLVELTPAEERADFFREHVFLYDIQPEMVQRCIERAQKLGIPETLARQNIRCQDTLGFYPEEILQGSLPVYHVTNPPYLYIGYIAKHPETQKYSTYFQGVNEGYQDLYQIALMNDLRHNIPRMVYIIPTNFLFGYSNSNKIRDDFLPFYEIERATILEKELFEHTGTHVMIVFFKRKACPRQEPQTFVGFKVRHEVQRRVYRLSPAFHYRAGAEFEEFTTRFRVRTPLKVRYYLHRLEIDRHPGERVIHLIDANGFTGKSYDRFTARVDEVLYRRVVSNSLFVRTLDTGTPDGRAGLYLVPEVFKADGIVVTGSSYRTHPIQLFLEPPLPYEDVQLLRDYFNLLLEYFRALTDSEFLTTYKYSDSAYTRKYLGLSQVRALIETFPYLDISPVQREHLRRLVGSGDAEAVIETLKTYHAGGNLTLWD